MHPDSPAFGHAQRQIDGLNKHTQNEQVNTDDNSGCLNASELLSEFHNVTLYSTPHHSYEAAQYAPYSFDGPSDSAPYQQCGLVGHTSGLHHNYGHPALSLYDNALDYASYHQGQGYISAQQRQHQYGGHTSPLQSGVANLATYEHGGAGIQTPQLQHPYMGHITPLQNGAALVQQGRDFVAPPETQHHHANPTMLCQAGSVRREALFSATTPGHALSTQNSASNYKPQLCLYETRLSTPISPYGGVGNSPQLLNGITAYAAVSTETATYNAPQLRSGGHPPSQVFHQALVYQPPQPQGISSHPQADPLRRSPYTQNGVTEQSTRTQDGAGVDRSAPQHGVLNIEQRMHTGASSNALQSPSRITTCEDGINDGTVRQEPHSKKRAFDQMSPQLRQGHATPGEEPPAKKTRLGSAPSVADMLSDTPKVPEDTLEDIAKPKRKPTKSLESDKMKSIEMIRRVRRIAFRVTHPPPTAFSGNRITKSWLKKEFPENFKGNARALKASSILRQFGREKLNMTGNMWKSLDESDRNIRPEYPHRIEDRQIVRCDEKHSLEDHSPLGATSVQCVNCQPRKIDGFDPPKRHMMCPACIREHETALSDHAELAELVRGEAWTELCDSCMVISDQLEKCKCEWDVPRCLEHRRHHLEKLLKSCGSTIIKGPSALCNFCFVNPPTIGIAYAWKCQMCYGVFRMPNDLKMTWLPNGPPLFARFATADDNVAQRLSESTDVGLAEANFDFSLGPRAPGQ
ncbi:hypothetical protein MPH_04325 [Macrophomina phaseolina MS6]|uniref:Uncharacterized protein n=1 Tax=Macrophomina phaseolina (strain MS6) TaxID=1126212 RepID=K2RUS8_MACPH|nr:hypothetical protein MPH_04325 [Macrophomina phaseolina MS6]